MYYDRLVSKIIAFFEKNKQNFKGFDPKNR